MQEKLSWHNEKRKVNELIPNPENPRRMSEKQSEELRKSLEKFNLAEIPAVNTDNRIVAGHMRVAKGNGTAVGNAIKPNNRKSSEGSAGTFWARFRGNSNV